MISVSKYVKKFISFAVSGAICLSLCSAQPVFCDSTEISSDAAAEIAVDPTGKSDGYSAVVYDNTSGLPTSEANDIAETDEGFIWIGSYSGLIRYDGSSFERIDSTTGIASVVELFVDSKNRLWVGTNDNGVAVMENGEFTMYGKADGLRSLSIRSITEDGIGNILIATTQGIAIVDPDGNMSAVDEPQLNTEFITQLMTGHNGIVYGITREGAVFTMKYGRLSRYITAGQLGISDAYSILPDPESDGWLYIGTKGSKIYQGMLEKGFSVADTIDISPLGYVNNMDVSGDMLWVCTDNGIGYVRDGEMTVIDNTPMNTSVEQMMVDYQGNLWFVSSQQGVMKIVPNRFTDIFEKYHLADEVVYSTCTLKNELYIGTKNSGLLVLRNGVSVSSIPLKSNVGASGAGYSETDLIELMEGCKIRSIVRDSKDRLWFSTFGGLGLVRYDHGDALRFTTADGLPSDRVRTVIERNDGSFLAVCTGGAVVISDDKIVDVFNEADGLSNTEILTAAEDGSGNVVLGTDGGGLYCISESGTKHIGTDDGLNSDVVMRVKYDKTRDVFWIVTSNSLAYMDAECNAVTVQKFPYSNNFDLYENSLGEMWVLSSNGIYVISADELIENGEIEPLYYGRDNGLQCITTSNSYSELTDSGDLYIAGTTGVVKVNIETPFEDVGNIKMSVPYVEADGEFIYPDEKGEIVITSDVKKMTVYSYVYNYSLMNPQVTYLLNGFDKTPVTVKRSELVPVSYTNLRGGSYSFVMKIKDPQGGESKELTVKIIKEKAVYEQVWFMVICALLAAALTGLLIKLYIDRRTARFLKKEKEQKELIKEIAEAFAKVIDLKDKYTNGHSKRVAVYTKMLSEELGLDEETIDKYYYIALLHDIGKIGVPPEVLNKPGKLTDDEFIRIKSHSSLGHDALKDISIMPELAVGAGSHHERPDGKGYPEGLKGDEIPRVAQIIAVADTFDAMYSDRPYRKRMNFDKAVSIIREVRGTQLAEDVVDAFLRLVEKGNFRAKNDTGGGSMEDINNIHKKQEQQEAKKEEAETVKA